MEARFEVRKDELLDECQLTPQTFRDVTPRLQRFMEPFVENLVREEQCAHARTYACGLLSDLDHKNVESIAYRFGQGRMGLQRFVGFSNWDESPLIDELVRQVSHELAEPDAVIVFDPSAFPKSGKESVGVARQWCGRLGKIDNCQVGVFMGYVSCNEHVLLEEQYLQRSKSEAGLADYEVRTWTGWHHHQALSLIATWFLLKEACRGKKWTPAITLQQIRQGISDLLHHECGCGTPWRIRRERQQRLVRNELARLYHWKRHNHLAPLNVNKRNM